MSIPSINIAVQPMQNGKATYAPLAATTSNGKAQGKIVLRLDITNSGSKTLTISGISFAFPGSQVATLAMQGVKQFFTAYYPMNGEATLAPGQTKTYTNGRVRLVPDDAASQVNNAVVLNLPMPGKIEVHIECVGYTQPAKIVLALAAHKNSTPQDSYLYPFSASDLRIAEYYVGQSTHWANGGAGGGQIFAHDLGCEGFDQASGQWSRLLPGKDGKHNADYRFYDKPIRAMADGSILSWYDGMDDNTVLGKFPDPTPSPGSGNSVTVLYGEEKVIYCHLQKGSMPAALQQVGAVVKAGQMLGRVGNTGNASEPHIHIEIEFNNPASYLRPFLFHDTYVIAQNAFAPPDPTGPWSKLAKQGLPIDLVAIWPGPHAPAWYPPGWGELSFFGVAEAAYQTLFNHATSSGYRPVWLDGYEVKGHTFFNVIFRTATNIAWQAQHGMSGAQYQAVFDTAKQNGFRLSNLSSYVSGGKLVYAAIFDKVGGSAMHAYHGVGKASHQQSFNDFTKAGFVPVNVSVTAVGGVLQFAAFYVKQDVGSFVHLAELSAAAYQSAWDSNVAAGRQLAYLSACQTASGPQFSAIFQQKTAGSGSTVGKHNLSASKMQAAYDAQLAAGRLTRVLVGYEAAGQAMFAAAWRHA